MEQISREFLELIGVSDDEINDLLPQWIKTAEWLGLTEEKVKYAVREWIPRNWNMELAGIQKCIAAYIRELIEIYRFPEYKNRGDKLVYGNIPAHPAVYHAIRIKAGSKVHIAVPEFMITTVMNSFFNERESQSDNKTILNSRCCHCGLNRIRMNARMEKSIISPDVNWGWGLYCNESSKCNEMLECLDGEMEWENIHTTFPHDAYWGEKEAYNEYRVSYLAKEIRTGQERVSAITGIEVTDEEVRQAVKEYTRYAKKVDYLNQIVGNADPQPISGNELTLFSAILPAPLNFGFFYLEDAIDILTAEVEARISKGIGILPKGAPKLGCYFTPFITPWINTAFLDNGINISVGTFLAGAMDTEQFQDDDVYRIIARQWFLNPSAVNMGNEIELIVKILEKYNLDGMLYGFFAFDRWLGMHQKMMIPLLEEKTGIQYFYLEGDFWNDEKYSLKDRMSRIENIAYYLKVNRAIRVEMDN